MQPVVISLNVKPVAAMTSNVVVVVVQAKLAKKLPPTVVWVWTVVIDVCSSVNGAK